MWISVHNTPYYDNTTPARYVHKLVSWKAEKISKSAETNRAYESSAKRDETAETYRLVIFARVGTWILKAPHDFLG